MRVLFPIMVKLGDDNAAVSRSAYETLAHICRSCDYKSVDELIARNADYLVNAISLDMKYVFVNRRAPSVLKVMIQYSNCTILSIIEDTLMEIFFVIDLYPDELLHLLINVLHTLVQKINKWFPPLAEEHRKEEGEVEVRYTLINNALIAPTRSSFFKLSFVCELLSFVCELHILISGLFVFVAFN